MPATTITAGDATNGSAVTAGGNDGTLKLQTGPAGAKVDAVTFAADGTPTFIKQPVLPVQSMIRLNTGNGFGSTNTAIRRFTNTVVSQGSDITYADSATLGASFTINTSGVYAISYSDSLSTQNAIGISLNSSQLTTYILSITAAGVLDYKMCGLAQYPDQVSVTAYLPAGSVIRAHTNTGVAAGAYGIARFTITRVA